MICCLLIPGAWIPGKRRSAAARSGCNGERSTDSFSSAHPQDREWRTSIVGRTGWPTRIGHGVHGSARRVPASRTGRLADPRKDGPRTMPSREMTGKRQTTALYLSSVHGDSQLGSPSCRKQVIVRQEGIRFYLFVEGNRDYSHNLAIGSLCQESI